MRVSDVCVCVCVCVGGGLCRGGGAETGGRGSVGACAPSHKAIEASCGTVVIVQAQFYEDHLSQNDVRTHARVNVMPPKTGKPLPLSFSSPC